MTEARRADLAYVATAAFALGALAAFGALQRRLELIGNDDLSRIWAGPRALLTGADPYDPATWAATAHALGTLPPDTPVYIYPPWVALVLVPLALLPLNVASLTWLVASVVAGITGLRFLLRVALPGRPLMHAVAAAMLLLSWVGALSLVIGQWGFLLVAALSATVGLLRRGRPASAGAAAVALIAKPQLFVLAAPALALHALRDRRVGLRYLGVAVGISVALVALAWLAVPTWWPTWLFRVGGVQLGPDSDTVAGLLFALFGPQGPSATPIVLVLLAVPALRFHPRAESWVAVWLALSLVAAPYTNSYDQIILVVPIVIASGVALRYSVRRAWIVLGAGAAALILGTPVLYEVAVRRHSETFGVIVPLLVYGLILVSLWDRSAAREWSGYDPGSAHPPKV